MIYRTVRNDLVMGITSNDAERESEDGALFDLENVARILSTCGGTLALGIWIPCCSTLRIFPHGLLLSQLTGAFYSLFVLSPLIDLQLVLTPYFTVSRFIVCILLKYCISLDLTADIPTNPT